MGSSPSSDGWPTLAAKLRFFDVFERDVVSDRLLWMHVEPAQLTHGVSLLVHLDLPTAQVARIE